MESEILSDNELAEITGYKHRAWQRRWLSDHAWHFVESRGGRPLVGRQYARMMLGVKPWAPSDSAAPPPSSWSPDFSRVNG